VKNRINYRLAMIALLALSGSAFQAQEPSDQKSLPNFHQVNQQLYRGAQPKTSDYQKLVRIGIRTVVNLRGAGEGVLKEEGEVRSQGLRYFNIPLARAGRPRDADVERLLAIINDPEYQPVFLHCHQGADRTGTVIALYRITHDGWTSEEAKAEAKRYGMHLWEVAMKNYIHDFYLRHTKQKQAASQ
jgi:tyrosine-protein phosphatase SIW14